MDGDLLTDLDTLTVREGEMDKLGERVKVGELEEEVLDVENRETPKLLKDLVTLGEREMDTHLLSESETVGDGEKEGESVLKREKEAERVTEFVKELETETLGEREVDLEWEGETVKVPMKDVVAPLAGLGVVKKVVTREEREGLGDSERVRLGVEEVVEDRNCEGLGERLLGEKLELAEGLTVAHIETMGAAEGRTPLNASDIELS